MLRRQLLQLDETWDPLILDELDDDTDQIQESFEEDESSALKDDLIAQENSLSASLVRQWHYTRFIKRLAWWGIKHKSEIPTASTAANLPTRLAWLTGEGIPLDAWSMIRRTNTIKAFFGAAGFVVADIGATLLAPLLLHDLISYGLFPEERCGTSSLDILAGVANNQNTWTYHFGSDVIHEAAYWLWLGVLVLPPTAGFIRAFLRDRQLRSLGAQDVIHNLETALLVLDTESLTFKDTCLSLLPWSRLNRTLAEVKLTLLWDGRKDSDQRLLMPLNLKQVLVNTLLELAQSNYFLIRYRAMQLLAQVAASFHPQNLDRFIEDPVHKTGLAQLRETILAALRKEPLCEASTRQSLLELDAACVQPLPFETMDSDVLLPNRQWGGMARYFRWTLGDDTGLLTQLFWIPTLLIAVYKFYSIGRYLELIVKKLIDIIYYFHDKSVCENKGYYFKFLTQSERYECVACDWPFVNYQHGFFAQTCLERLLQQKITPIELRRYLSELPAVRGVTRVDLSQQDWSNWPVSDWEKLLLALEPMVASLELFNVSRITEGIKRVPVQHLQALTRLLTQIHVTQFDMSHYRLTDELFPSLLDALANQSLSALYLSDTNMTDASASYLSELISNSSFNLTDLHLAGNQIGDRGITQVSQIVANSALQILNVARNLFSDFGLQQLGLGIQHSVVQSLDLSDQLLSTNGLKLFSDALQGNSSLSGLKLRNVGLTNDHIRALPGCLENLEFLDVSDNLLDSQTIQSILNLCRQNLKTFIANNNDLDEEAGRLIAQELSATALHYLDLSKNYLRAGFNDLARALPNSQLLSLICEECDLTDADVAELTPMFANDSLVLQSLNLNKNKITNQTLLNCVAVLPKTALRELHLNNNEIASSNASAAVLAQGLTQNLTVLDLSSNQLDSNFFTELASLLHQSPLQRLNLSGNTIETASAKHFSESLVQLPCHRQDLNAPQLSRQEKRVFYPMKQNTQLNQLDMADTDVDSATLRGFCRVAASLPDIRFLESKRMAQLDWRSCELLSHSRPPVRLEQTSGLASNQTHVAQRGAWVLASPFVISLLCAGGILAVIALLYVAYRASRSSYRFFRPAPTIARAESESEENSTHANLRRSFP